MNSGLACQGLNGVSHDRDLLAVACNEVVGGGDSVVGKFAALAFGGQFLAEAASLRLLVVQVVLELLGARSLVGQVLLELGDAGT